MESIKLDNLFYSKCYKDYLAKPYNPIGVKENRLKSRHHFNLLYPDFDINIYKISNNDLKTFSDIQLIEHFHRCGKHEKRKYKNNNNDTENIKPILYPHDYLNLINIKKIKEIKDNTEIKDNDINITPSNMIYLVISEWGYPPYGGGECWLIDTIKWMTQIGYKCYYIFFKDLNNKIPNPNANLYTNINMNVNTNTFYSHHIHDNIHFIKLTYDKQLLYKLVKEINPKIISHQGSYRYEIMKMAKILDIYFVSGFCFWNDIIEYERGVMFNHKLLSKDLKPTSTFKKILNRSDYLYVCGDFVNDVINKIYNIKLPVIYTISNINNNNVNKYNPVERKYVTIINISKFYDNKILLKILEKTNPKIPFYIVDSQGHNDDFITHIKKILFNTNNTNNTSNANVEHIIKSGHHDVFEIYKQTKILLILSFVDETFCRVAYEGMYLKIPIISTSYGNLGYLLDGYANFLTDNPKEWSDLINELYFNNKMLIEMSKRSTNMIMNKYNNTKDLFIYNMNKLFKIPKKNKKTKVITLFCPWTDQGLGIQCREYYKQLTYLGYHVKIFSHKPFIAVQTDFNEWILPEKDIYYSKSKRNEITFDEFEDYVINNEITHLIIVEFSTKELINLVMWAKLFNIYVICIPNIEILRYDEICYLNYFDSICVNNMSTYDILKNLNINNVIYLGFHLGICELDNNLKMFTLIDPINTLYTTKNDMYIEFFCCGGLNSFTRKNIDKIINVFTKLIKLTDNFILHVYIQGNISNMNNMNNMNNFLDTQIIKYHITNLSYKEILKLYTTHDIFIHLGDHEGLGLGLYESLYYLCPVITINCPPNNEIINSNNGFLINPCKYIDLVDNCAGIIKRAVINEEDIYKVIKRITKNNIKSAKQSIINTFNVMNTIDNYFQKWNNIINE